MFSPVNEFDLTGEMTREYSVSVSRGYYGSVGLIFDDGKIYYTVGTGVGTPGAGFAIMYGKGHANEGLALTGSASYGAAAQASWSKKNGRSMSYGTASPGLSGGIQYTEQLTACTFGIRCKGKGRLFKTNTNFVNDLKSGNLKKNQPNSKRK